MRVYVFRVCLLVGVLGSMFANLPLVAAPYPLKYTKTEACLCCLFFPVISVVRFFAPEMYHEAFNSILGNPEFPLRIAVRRGTPDDVRRVLNDGADIEKVDTYGCTPLLAAVRNNALDMVKVLTDRGADLQAVGGGHYTPFEWAVHLEYLDIAEFLVERGVRTSLHRFVDNGLSDGAREWYDALQGSKKVK